MRARKKSSPPSRKSTSADRQSAPKVAVAGKSAKKKTKKNIANASRKRAAKSAKQAVVSKSGKPAVDNTASAESRVGDGSGAGQPLLPSSSASIATLDGELILSQRITIQDVGKLKRALASAPRRIDVRAVEQVDTSALQLLVAYANDAAVAEREIQWLGANSQVSRAVALAGLGTFFTFESVPDDAEPGHKLPEEKLPAVKVPEQAMPDDGMCPVF